MTEHSYPLPKTYIPHNVTSRCPRCGNKVFLGSDHFGRYLHCLFCGMYYDIDTPHAQMEDWIYEYNKAPLNMVGTYGRRSRKHISPSD